jgi:outer membrane receptor protein involved in Fe transport
MTTRSLRLSALLGSISALAFAGAAAAADASAPNIEEVVVTASKRSEEVKNVPMSVSVLGQADLDKLNARSYEDIVDNIPGMSLTESDPTHPDLTLRGINAGGVGSTVGTYIDETPFGSSNALANAADTAPNLDTYDMARVEVLRGPQGTLYGAAAEGGVLRFVTNAPDPSGFDDSFELGAFSEDHGGSDGSARGMVNIPFGDDLAVRAVGFYSETPGYITNAYLGHDHTNDLRSEGGRASILWQPTSKLTVRINAMTQQLDAGNSNSEDVVLVGDGFRPKYGDYVQQRTAEEPDGVRYYLYNATVNWDLDWATLTSSSSFDILHDYSFEDATATEGADVEGFLHQGKFTQEVRLASDPGNGPFDWLIGGYYTNEMSSLAQALVTSFHGPLALTGATLQLDANYNEIAAFANATYHITPQFDLSVGGRYSTNHQSDYEFGGTPPVLLPTPEFGNSSGNTFTWSADARYKLDEQTVFYARVATGFRPGGPNAQPVGGVAGVPQLYGSDSLTDYEAGVKSDLSDANLSFDADVFLINWKHIQLLADVNNTGVNINGGNARSQGVEADVTWTPIERLTLSLNGAYTDAELTQDVPITVQPLIDGLDGDPLPDVPKWSGTLSGDYQFAAMGKWTPYVGASWHYVGEAESSALGTLYQAVYGVPHSQYILPSYSTLDLRVGAGFGNWSIEFYAKNVNDAKGVTGFAPFGNSFASSYTAPIGVPIGAASVAVIQPRIVGVVLRGKI